MVQKPRRWYNYSLITIMNYIYIPIDLSTLYSYILGAWLIKNVPSFAMMLYCSTTEFKHKK